MLPAAQPARGGLCVPVRRAAAAPQRARKPRTTPESAPAPTPTNSPRRVAWLRLTPLLDRAPDRLSGGERARVALARALLTRPKLVLLDEPLSGLDVETRAALLPELAEALKRIAAPVVYVSHDPAEVARLADRVVRLRAGKIASPDDGPALELEGLPPERIMALAGRRRPSGRPGRGSGSLAAALLHEALHGRQRLVAHVVLHAFGVGVGRLFADA